MLSPQASAAGVFHATQMRLAVDYFRESENLTYNFGHADPVARAMASWLKSPAHRCELERPAFCYTGIAQVPHGKIYFTQLFIHPKL